MPGRQEKYFYRGLLKRALRIERDLSSQEGIPGREETSRLEQMDINTSFSRLLFLYAEKMYLKLSEKRINVYC